MGKRIWGGLRGPGCWLVVMVSLAAGVCHALPGLDCVKDPFDCLKGVWKDVKGLPGKAMDQLKKVPGVEDLTEKGNKVVRDGLTVISGVTKAGQPIVVKIAKDGIAFVERQDPKGMVTIIKVTVAGAETLYQGAKESAPILREAGEGIIEVTREIAKGNPVGALKEGIEAGKEILEAGKEVLLDQIQSESAAKQAEAAEGGPGGEGESGPGGGEGGGPDGAFLARLKDIYFIDDEEAAADIWSRFQAGNQDIDFNARMSNAVIDHAHATGNIPPPGHVVPPNPSATRGTVIDPAGVQVRTSPAGASAPRVLAQGADFTIVGQQGDWYQLSDGGWVPSLWVDVE